MKIYFLMLGDNNCPSSRYRGYNIINDLNKLGFKIRIVPVGDRKYFFNLISEFFKLLLPKKKVMYFQKTTHRIPVFLAKLHKHKGNKIIFDFDDSIFLVENKGLNSMIKLSDAVIVGNSYLKNYAEYHNKNVYVLPSSIDLKKISGLHKDYSKDNERIIIGWIGTHSNLEYLEKVRKPLENLSERHKIELRIIGPANSMEKLKKFKNIPISVIPWKLENEWKELSKIDIGIMPLSNDEWTKGKCALKLLQYMTLEIPAIGSSVGENKKTITNGKTGFLAKNEKEWEKYLEKLIESKKLRMKLGKAGRKIVEERYSLEKNAKKLAKIIKSLN